MQEYSDNYFAHYENCFAQALELMDASLAIGDYDGAAEYLFWRIKMKLSISNIGWAEQDDKQVYAVMKKLGFAGLEIAPTRIFPEKPYADLKAAKDWSECLLREHGFNVPSMQSIWYGRTEAVFGSDEERGILIDYTKKAIDFAEIIRCGNLVFGCPKNRSIPNGRNIEDSLAFFKELGEYAVAHNCVVAMEANPPIYNTNFLNTTKDAIDFIKKVDSEGFLLNLDLGTMIENEESVSLLKGCERYIHHVHISEPGLKPIQKRMLHKELASFLKDMDYGGFVSIEAGRQSNVEALFQMMEYVKEIFDL